MSNNKTEKPDIVSLKILGKTFQISYGKMPNLHGECNGPEYKIKISNKLSDQMIKQVIFHEAVHGALYVSGLSEILDGKDEKLEEALVVAMENAFGHAIDLSKLT